MLFSSISLKDFCGLISTYFARSKQNLFLPKEGLEDFYHVLAMEVTSVFIVFDSWMHSLSSHLQSTVDLLYIVWKRSAQNMH